MKKYYSSFQIRQEMLGALNFLKHVYSVFGFSFQLVLSTRPEKFLGEVNMWNEAEKVNLLIQKHCNNFKCIDGLNVIFNKNVFIAT